jgi:hypothetical protein
MFRGCVCVSIPIVLTFILESALLFAQRRFGEGSVRRLAPYLADWLDEGSLSDAIGILADPGDWLIGVAANRLREHECPASQRGAIWESEAARLRK